MNANIYAYRKPHLVPAPPATLYQTTNAAIRAAMARGVLGLSCACLAAPLCIIGLVALRVLRGVVERATFGALTLRIENPQ